MVEESAVAPNDVRVPLQVGRQLTDGGVRNSRGDNKEKEGRTDLIIAITL